jgi:UDP-glucose 4-epimerase
MWGQLGLRQLVSLQDVINMYHSVALKIIKNGMRERRQGVQIALMVDATKII